MEHEFNTPRNTDNLIILHTQRYLTENTNCLTANLRPRKLAQFWNTQIFDAAKIKHFTVYRTQLSFISSDYGIGTLKQY